VERLPARRAIEFDAQVPRAPAAHAAVSAPGTGAAHAATEDDMLRARGQTCGDSASALTRCRRNFPWPLWRCRDTLAAQLRSSTPELGFMQARAREHLNASVESWRRALGWYVRGLKDHDFREVDSAFRCLRNAEIHQEQARRLLRELESEPQPALAPPEPAAH
jgi:hypothetical protein